MSVTPVSGLLVTLGTVVACAREPVPRTAPASPTVHPMERAFHVGSATRRKLVQIVEGRPPEDFTSPRPEPGIDAIGGVRVDAARRRLWAVSAALNPMLDAVLRTEILESAHPLFDAPTTGTVVGPWIYVIANSQLWHPRPPRETIILKVPLDPANAAGAH